MWKNEQMGGEEKRKKKGPWKKEGLGKVELK